MAGGSHSSAGAGRGRRPASPAAPAPLGASPAPPPEMRTRSSGRPRAARSSAGMLAWLMKQGMLQHEGGGTDTQCSTQGTATAAGLLPSRPTLCRPDCICGPCGCRLLRIHAPDQRAHVAERHGDFEELDALHHRARHGNVVGHKRNDRPRCRGLQRGRWDAGRVFVGSMRTRGSLQG